MHRSHALWVLLVMTLFLPRQEASDDINLKYTPTKTSIIVEIEPESPYEITKTTCIGSDELEANCSSLEPCMSYNVTTHLSLREEVTTIDPQTTTEEPTETPEPEVIKCSESLIQTLFDTPTYWIQSIETREEELEIIWDAENKNCINKLSYDVRNGVTSNKESGVHISRNPIVVKDLHACQHYTVNLTAVDINLKDVKCKEDELCFQEAEMKYRHPENPTNITVDKETNEIVKLTWINPVDMFCVKNYTILSKIVGSERWDSAQIESQFSNEYLLFGLYGCEEYLVDVRLNIDLASFDYSDLDDTAYKFEAPVVVPKEPLIIKKDEMLTSTKTVTATFSWDWEPPKNHSKCVKSYTIEITSIEGKRSFQNYTKNFIVFEDLYPCTHYKFSVTPHTELEAGSTTFNNGTTFEEVQPDEVQNIQYVPLPYAFNLTWESPFVTKNCILQYRITGWATNEPTESSHKFEESTKETNYIAKNLISCMEYTIQIIPEGKSKMDGKHSQVFLEAMPTKEKDGSVELDASNPLPHSIDLRVKSTDQSNSCPVLFVKFYCVAAFTRNDVPHKAAEVILQAVRSSTWSATVQPLSPYTQYICRGSIFNAGGWADSKDKTLTTDTYFPSEPRNVTVLAVTAKSLNYSWSPPRYPNGQISIYSVVFKDLGPAFFQPKGCTSLIESDQTSQEIVLTRSFSTLRPFNKYSFQVCANNPEYSGEYSDVLITTTLPDVPPLVEGIETHLFDPDNTTTEYSAKVNISWNIPCNSNGKIEMFIVEFFGKRLGDFDDETHSFSRLVCPNGSVTDIGKCESEQSPSSSKISIQETNLRPDYNYRVFIAMKNYDVAQKGDQRFADFSSPAGLPEQPYFNEILVQETDIPSSSAKVVLQIANINDKNGVIERSALLISQVGCDEEDIIEQKITDYCSVDNPCPKPLTWSEASPADCVKQYQTTSEQWNIVGVDEKYKSSDHNTVDYTIGIDKCFLDMEEYCNGPLKPSTEYNVTLRIFTKNSYRDIHIATFTTESLIRLYVIVFSILGCLMVAFFGGFMYLWISKQQIWRKDTIHNEDQTGDISTKNFELHYSYISNRDKLQREFKELQVVAVDLSVTASRLNENRNRYSNIFPYDKNRVILDIDSDGSDYINASFINGYRRRKEYIATQGPKLDTAIDFWRMVLQHNVKVIVMVTQIKEGETSKCHQYFPMGPLKYLKFGNHITVMLANETSDDMHERREFSVKHSGDGYTRNVVQYHFKKWPDHDCPSDPQDLINFIKKIKSEKKSSHSPIVVHCSAGVGRTGTLIGLDIIMQRLKHESKINIFETVKKLRFQRMKMVQTIQQYTFLYTCTYQLLLQKRNSRNFPFKKEKPNKKTVSFKTDLVEGSPYIENGRTIALSHQPSTAESDL